MKILFWIILFLVVVIFVSRIRRPKAVVVNQSVEHDYHTENPTHHVRIIAMSSTFNEVYSLCLDAIALLTFCRVKKQDPGTGYIMAGIDWDLDSREDKLEVHLRKLDTGKIEVKITCEVMYDREGKININNKYAVDTIMHYLLAKDAEFHPEEDRCGDDLDTSHAFEHDD